MDYDKLVEELLSKSESSEKTTVMLKTSELHSFKDHPYKVIDNDEMAELTESIAEYGVLSPLIVRKDDNGYEVISGHRRLHAAVNSGLTEVPALVYNISRDEAAVMVVDSNLNREHILPSEKAAAYKMKYEALKHQGKASSHYETKLRTDEAIAETTGESRATIQRYMRLTELTPEWLNLVDEGRLAINTAVEISFLPEAHQNHLFSFYDENEILPTPKQAVEMKKLFQNGCLMQSDMDRIMKTEKANQKPKVHISVDRIRKYFTESDTPKSIEEYIIKLLEEDFLRKTKIKNKDYER